MKKRERLEVIYDILQTIKTHNNSIKPTPLQRYCNLSFRSFSEYEKELIEKEFITEIYDKNNRKHYSLADKGFEYLNQYHTIKKFISNFEL